MPVAALEREKRAKLAPAEAGVRAPAGEVHGIVVRIAAGEQLADPGFGVIVDPHQSGAVAGQTGVIEQCEIMEAKLSCGIAEQSAQLRQVRAGLRRVSEAIAQTPH